MIDKPGTVVGVAGALGDTFMRSLPAQFLVLVFLNICFIVGLLLFLDRQDATRSRVTERAMEAREHVLLPLLQACLTQAIDKPQRRD